MSYPKTMYEADYWGDIKPVKVLRETEKQIVLERVGYKGEIFERREAKESKWAVYFETWEDAKAHIVAKQEKGVIGLRAELERANGRLGQLRGMKKPEES